jgi:hypothetical protein
MSSTDQGFGRVQRDAYASNASTHAFDQATVHVAKHGVFNRVDVGEIFAIDDTTETSGGGNVSGFLAGPSSSGSNQIASFSDTTGSSVQASLAVADTAGTIAATSLFVGSDPSNSGTYTGGILSSGAFVSSSSTQTSWSLHANFTGASTLRATRVGQLVTLTFALVIGGSSIVTGQTLATAPVGFRPASDQSIVMSVVNAGGTTPGLGSFATSGALVGVVSATFPANSTLNGSITYVAS